MEATLFLDRDGVINRRIMNGYVSSLSELELLEGAIESMAALSQAGFRLAVVTNQRGISLGLYDMDTLKGIHAFISDRVSDHGGRLEEFYVCPHGRDEGCSCRKPRPGLLDQANEIAPVAWEHSILVGDSDTDLQAGSERGLHLIKIGPIESVKPHRRFDSLASATPYLLDLAKGL